MSAHRPSVLAAFAAVALLLLPAPAQAQKLRLVTVMPSPQGVTAGYSNTGVQLSWQGVAEATQYLVMRGRDAATLAQIVVVPAGTGTYLDQGFNAPASYQIVAVSGAGLRGPSAVVAYAPPVTMVMPKAPIATLTPINPINKTALGSRLTPVSLTPPVITSLAQPPSGSTFVRNGDEVLVQGTGLDGLTSVALQNAYNANAAWYLNKPSPQIPVTPIKSSATSFSFVPQVPTPYGLTTGAAYMVIVTKGAVADTSKGVIQVGATLPVRKITSVARAIIRSGARVQVTGVGLDQVIGGYFGPGTQGSVTNPLLSVWNRSATYLELETTAACSQEGLLMLKHQAVPGESDLILPAQPITVACVSGTPAGAIQGSEATANGIVNALPGSMVSIKGTNLKYVTRVTNGGATSYPFTYSKVGSSDFLSVQLPGPRPDGAEGGAAFYLENSLIGPVVAGTVTGAVTIMAAPTFYRVDPAWAEPGQLVHVYGHQLKYNATPQVWVGGQAAQVVSGTSLQMSFRMPAGATTGPIEVQNEVGKTALTGPFTAGAGTQHPGFFVVSGPSVITQITAPNATLAYGDVITVTGQNLARLGGICVKSSGQGGVNPGYLALRRAEAAGSAQMGAITSNTVMQVTLAYQAYSVASGPVQLYQSSQPVGDMPPTEFACVATTNPISWP